MWAVCRIIFLIDIPYCIVFESNIKYVREGQLPSRNVHNIGC